MNIRVNLFWITTILTILILKDICETPYHHSNYPENLIGGFGTALTTHCYSGTLICKLEMNEISLRRRVKIPGRVSTLVFFRDPIHLCYSKAHKQSMCRMMQSLFLLLAVKSPLLRGLLKPAHYGRIFNKCYVDFLFI